MAYRCGEDDAVTNTPTDLLGVSALKRYQGVCSCGEDDAVTNTPTDLLGVSALRRCGGVCMAHNFDASRLGHE
jgi:hypothetical protein